MQLESLGTRTNRTASESVRAATKRNLVNQLSTLLTRKGSWFALKSNTTLTQDALNSMTAEQLETYATNPDNYEKPSSGFVVLNNEQGGMMRSVPTSAFDNGSTGQSWTPVVESVADWNASEGVVTDAARVFKVTVDGDRIYLRSQGLNTHWDNTTVQSNSTPAQIWRLFPYGRGTATVVAVNELTEDPWTKGLKNENGKAVTNILRDEPSATGWLLQPAKKIRVNAKKITYNGDYYQGKSFASLAFDFPVRTTDPAVHLLVPNTVTDNSVSMRDAENGTVPAGTPFILKDDNGRTTLDLEITTDAHTSESTNGNVFKPLYVAQQFGTVLNYNETWVLSVKADPQYWQPVGNGGGLTSIAFRRSATTDKLAGNRGYLRTNISTSASKEAFFIDFGPIATGINLPMQHGIPNVFYDLQGRKVSHPTKGIYIYNGKKVVVQ